MSQSSDSIASEQLLAEFGRNRSESAFRELVQRHLSLVYNTALRVTNGDQHLAEDIAQIVFTDLAGKASRLSSATIVAGWLHQHTWFTASKAIRTERRRAVREQQSIDMVTSNNDASGLDHLQPIVDEALTTLNPEDRDALVLRYFENADLRRVGASFGVSEDAAQKRVARALEKLRSVLAARGVTVSSIALGTFLAAQSAAAPLSLAQTVSAAALTGVASAPLIATILGSAKAKLSLAALLAGALATPLVWQQNTISQLRSESSRLQASLAQLENLSIENAELRKRTFSQAEMDRLNKDLSELRRLRGEVTLLRQQQTNSLSKGAREEQTEHDENLFAQIMIRAEVAELKHERMTALLTQGFPAVGDPSNFTIVFDAEKAEEVIKLFEKTEGVDLLSAPRISTADRRQAQITVTDVMPLPGGESVPLGLTVDVLPEVQKNKTSVKLALDVKVTEFVGWGNDAQTVPRLRTRSATQEIVLEYGQMLMMGRSVVKHDGEETEPKLQIYCFRSTVITPTGEPVPPKSEITSAETQPAGP